MSGGVGRGASRRKRLAVARFWYEGNAFAPLPAEQMCTEQYGGPQTARVSGTWAGDPVDLTLARSDGCHISQWEGLVPLVPITEGAF